VVYSLACAWFPSVVPSFRTNVFALFTVFLAGPFGGASANLPTYPTSDTKLLRVLPLMGATTLRDRVGLRSPRSPEGHTTGLTYNSLFDLGVYFFFTVFTYLLFTYLFIALHVSVSLNCAECRVTRRGTDLPDVKFRVTALLLPCTRVRPTCVTRARISCKTDSSTSRVSLLLSA